MKLDLVLKNATVVLPEGSILGDLGLLNGKIAKIGKISDSAPLEKDCTGLHVLPGIIDMHVHFRDPGFPEKEDFFTGSCAAVAGGVTTVMDMPNTNPPTLDCESLEAKRKIAAKKSLVNFGFYMGLAENNLEEIKKAKNIAGVKIYMGSTTGNLLIENAETIEKFFELKKFAIIHAEDEQTIREHAEKYAGTEDPSLHSVIRCPEAASRAITNILHLARKCEAPVHITHVSTADEVDELRKFKSDFVSADATPHHLLLKQSAYAKLGNLAKINPPLRTDADIQALFNALHEGIIQAVSSDHAPHEKSEKIKPYSLAPAGVPGVETLLPLLLDCVNHGQFELNEVVRFLSENPARLLEIRNKGKVIEGFDADLAIVDMGKEMEVGARGYFSKCGWSPFDGKKIIGWPITTIIGGRIVFENGKLNKTFRGSEVVFPD